MRKLYCSPEGQKELDLRELRRNASRLVKLAGGRGILLGICDDGKLVQASADGVRKLSTGRWRDLKDVSASLIYTGVAAGVRRDGTCVISQAALQDQLERHDAERVIRTVGSWRRVKEIAVNDAVYALHEDGTVSCADFNRENISDELAVSAWNHIRRIIPGLQGIAAGLCHDGSLVFTRSLPEMREIYPYLPDKGIRDFCFEGAEATRTAWIGADKKLYFSQGACMGGTFRELCSGYYYCIAAREENGSLWIFHRGTRTTKKPVTRKTVLFTVGNTGDVIKPFTAAVNDSFLPF